VIVHTAHLLCKPDVIDAFKERLRSHARLTRAKEAGCLRFDIHQSVTDPSVFFLHEVYDDDVALQAHHNSEHFHSFREDVSDWVIERRWWFWSSMGDE